MFKLCWFPTLKRFQPTGGGFLKYSCKEEVAVLKIMYSVLSGLVSRIWQTAVHKSERTALILTTALSHFLPFALILMPNGSLSKTNVDLSKFGNKLLATVLFKKHQIMFGGHALICEGVWVQLCRWAGLNHAVKAKTNKHMPVVCALW